ncbi:hypothetical protein HK097_007175 [Rhizophlyctis rosea]|uniref:F-box domain-containing protein n=1 Tax=Rhizophlyctis rosea TaxID=64517 RepID=A0AAD5SDG7_9FUNG|nr:hypothetical protein HK097_007175 [Rhizophlyctis rosea]
MPCKACAGSDHKTRGSKLCKEYKGRRRIVNPALKDPLPTSQDRPPNNGPLVAAAPTLKDIPDDVKKRIVPYLSGTAIVRLNNICRSWHAAFEDETFWRLLYAKTFNICTEEPPAKKHKKAHPGTSTDANIPRKKWMQKYLADVGRMCLGCHTITDNLCPLSNDRVCPPCRTRLPQYALITKGRAKTEYRLNDTDLASIRYISARNPHFRSAAPMCLYLAKHLQHFAERKHGGPEGLRQARIKAANAKENRSANAAARRDNRRTKLIDALQKRGLELRSDSRLCQAYIRKGKGSIKSIVETMYTMHLLHEHSIYTELLDDSYADVQEEAEYDGKFQLHWEENKETQEGRALELLEQAEKAYKGPADGRQDKICSCGRVNIRHLVLDLYEKGKDE